MRSCKNAALFSCLVKYFAQNLNTAGTTFPLSLPLFLSFPQHVKRSRSVSVQPFSCSSTEFILAKHAVTFIHSAPFSQTFRWRVGGDRYRVMHRCDVHEAHVFGNPTAFPRNYSNCLCRTRIVKEQLFATVFANRAPHQGVALVSV